MDSAERAVPAVFAARRLPVVAMVGVASVLLGLLVWGCRPDAAPHFPVAAVAASQTCPAGERAHREYVLEVIGLGVTLDRYRQGALWEALQQGGVQDDIRERDPRKLPRSASDKRAAEQERSRATLVNGVAETPMDWGVPTFHAGPPRSGLSQPLSVDDVGSVVGPSLGAGMPRHRFLSAAWKQSERPDQLLDHVFAYFDEHPDLPYVVLSASDGSAVRDAFRSKGSLPLVRDGHRLPAMPDASMLLVLARRERIDLHRPLVIASWTLEQLASFDHLPTLGYLHRPVFVPLVDDDFKPLADPAQRAAVLADGWQRALLTLPEADRPAAPARVIGASRGGNPGGEQAADLGTLFQHWALQGGAAIDPNRPEQWVDTDARLGNLGAATWFMQIALGVMGSYRDGGVSAAINLRDPRVASIVLISPPPPSQRRQQQHPLGGDVFRDHSAPAGRAPR